MEKQIIIIPARASSKGCINKHIRHNINRQTLLDVCFNKLRELRNIDIYFLTDSFNMANYVSDNYSFVNVPYIRSYSTDDEEISTVIMEFIKRTEYHGFITILQCTSPLIEYSIISNYISLCYSLQKTDMMYTIHDSGLKYTSLIINDKRLTELPFETPRQKLPSVYAFNGAMITFHTYCLIQTGSIMCIGKHIRYPIPETQSLDIDTEEDFLEWNVRLSLTLI